MVALISVKRLLEGWRTSICGNMRWQKMNSILIPAGLEEMLHHGRHSKRKELPWEPNTFYLAASVSNYRLCKLTKVNVFVANEPPLYCFNQTRKTTKEKTEKPISMLNKEDTYHHLGWTHAVVILARGHRVAWPSIHISKKELNTILSSFSAPTQENIFVCVCKCYFGLTVWW